MKIILNNVSLSLEEDEKLLKKKIIEELKIKPQDLISFQIIKKAIDARKKNHILLVYSLLVDLKCEEIPVNKNVAKNDFQEDLIIPHLHMEKRPIIVGFGPSGMFLGLFLARAGVKPIILERGKKVEERINDINLFKEKGIFSSSSNVCFGEGGAGTFSDGKLMTGIKDSRIRFVIKEFIAHGAPQEIYYEAHPHIGSDYLRNVVKNIREEIISLGGEVRFEHQMIDFISENDTIKKVIIKNHEHLYQEETDDLILCIGHSAHDTFEMLHHHQLKMNPKPFSLGVRVEMKQDDVNKAQYGNAYLNKKLKPAEYKLVAHLDNGRCVYSFCMCPGGVVVGSNTEENTILVNGMSYFKRDLENANSALLVNVNVDDYYVDSPLDGMYLQQEIERKAFNPQYPYYAPVQLVGDFLNHQISTKIGNVQPSYLPGYYFASLDDILPSFICSSLREGIKILSNKLTSLRKYDNVLTGVETRSSSPISIPRDENGYSSIKGIYPCGEGASYAGGITSACIDGLRIGECIKNKYLK